MKAETTPDAAYTDFPHGVKSLRRLKPRDKR